MVTRCIVPAAILLAAFAPAWGGGQTRISDYDAAEARFFWDRLYERAPPDPVSIYRAFPAADRWQ